MFEIKAGRFKDQTRRRKNSGIDACYPPSKTGIGCRQIRCRYRNH